MSLRGKSVPDPVNQGWIDLVERCGHAIVCVADAVDKPTGDPPFVYSIGACETHGGPELIVFGLDPDVASEIINDFVAQHAEGRRFRRGVSECGLLAGDMPVVLLEAAPALALDYATHADWYYERKPFPLWQLFCPAKNGCFPWDADYPPYNWVGSRT